MFKRRFPKAYNMIWGTEDAGRGTHEQGPEQQQQRRSPPTTQQQQQAPAAAKPITIHDLQSGAHVIMESPGNNGGCQSLKWERQSLQRDEDGDEAHEFIVCDAPR